MRRFETREAAWSVERSHRAGSVDYIGDIVQQLGTHADCQRILDFAIKGVCRSLNRERTEIGSVAVENRARRLAIRPVAKRRGIVLVDQQGHKKFEPVVVDPICVFIDILENTEFNSSCRVGAVNRRSTRVIEGKRAGVSVVNCDIVICKNVRKQRLVNPEAAVDRVIGRCTKNPIIAGLTNNHFPKK